ncbi:hypothetical protein DM860_014971 [Cuscuta australis]|uniref:Uncharacterized protein n=1 Tax=Cuscuta australis TaxID=267555 RepID=A0A328E2A6_9ASTE|nr:hypothetical protein DM860_014971 [Cuscuta australis]
MRCCELMCAAEKEDEKLAGAMSQVCSHGQVENISAHSVSRLLVELEKFSALWKSRSIIGKRCYRT